MPIPKEILAIERPKGTVVQHSGNKYYVIKRTSKYVNGRRVPVNIGTVGEIHDGQYFPRIKKLDGIEVDVKDYGNVELANQHGRDLLNDLRKFFNVQDADRIYAYALLKVIYGDITSRDLAMHYDTSFVSEYYPRVPCSRKSVGEFLDVLGRHVNKLDSFMKARLDSIDPNAYVIVDGMLKNNNSETNTYSEFSRKSKIKNSQDISLLYAVDYEKKEPLACSVYPGNMLDKTSFEDFKKRFDITKGVLIGDKGFVIPEEQKKQIAEDSNLKYLIPIKRDSKVIHDYNLLDYDEVLNSTEAAVLCKKTKAKNGVFYYSFLDLYQQGVQGQNFVFQEKKKVTGKKTIEKLLKKYNNKKETFGTITFESNLDISSDEVYKMYSYRWTIEEIFNYYKNVLDIDNVRVQDDTRLYGSEFINYIATVITCRIKNSIDKLNLTKKYSYNQIMLYLSKVKKCRNVAAPTEWHNTTTLKYIQNLISDLNLDV